MLIGWVGLGNFLYQISVPECGIEVLYDDVNVLEKRLQVEEGQLAQILESDVPDVVVVVQLGGERPESYYLVYQLGLS